ncbi:NAD-dependent succinate-semialdehyde dehydrogenase [Bradyrhizobium diazoefficiens]|uniref:NAD-dependent succinate-semialdehyde dehydrogenase n=1 Tax=Bradyrhizobium diazoefficiens TaxID=1355477 RepID=UPI00190E160D|nr:NAD-dependent succinate-semialdehyde dehydrogenase [Bradyrhizobium diazoefficiens]QQO16761.1 NAD-dependent succinate-semialdehyde dehydrogenase [Bradyrhizobium diazoefficiens]
MTIASQLKDPSLLAERCFVGGGWIDADGEATFPVDNPATGAIIGNVPQCGARETGAAIAAAEQAFQVWRKKTAGERGELLERWFDLMIQNSEDLARIMTLEQGKPLAEARGEITYGASFVKWFAEEARRVYGETIPAASVDGRIIVQKQPIGVVAAITPWNFPNAMITRKAAPALAAGCTIVIKPAEATPFSALALAVLAERAGIPKGVLNVLTGRPADIGAALTKSPVVRKLTFTGSTRVGKLLMEQCAATVKRVGLELGGNAPFVIFDDADLDAAITGVVASKFRNGGQTCVCANRIFVQSGIYDAFADRLVAATSKLKVGDGLVDGTTIGPMINQAAIDKIQQHVDDAVSRGAAIVLGGNAMGGLFYQPTVLKDVTTEMRVAQEETFGPVAPLFRFANEADAIAMANDTPFGLASYLYTRDISRAFRVAEALEFGMIGINAGSVSTTTAPFGGIKESGLGREGSHHGIEEFLEMKTLHLGGI